MASVPFHYLELRTFGYATEDEQRVREALALLVPEDVPIDRIRTEGHHGDPIVIFEATLDDAAAMSHLLERLPGVPGFDRVLTGLGDRVDEDCSFYLRLDKQRAYQNEVAIGEGIRLRGKVEAYPATREGALDNLREWFQAIVDDHYEESTTSE